MRCIAAPQIRPAHCRVTRSLDYDWQRDAMTQPTLDRAPIHPRRHRHAVDPLLQLKWQPSGSTRHHTVIGMSTWTQFINAKQDDFQNFVVVGEISE